MALEISPAKVDSITVVTLKGTVVGGAAVALLLNKARELIEAGETRLIFDLGEVTFVDSTGIAALLKVSELASRKGGSAKLLHLTKRIHEVLQITRLSAVFGIFDDLQKAVASFGPTPAGPGASEA